MQRRFKRNNFGGVPESGLSIVEACRCKRENFSSPSVRVNIGTEALEVQLIEFGTRLGAHTRRTAPTIVEKFIETPGVVVELILHPIYGDTRSVDLHVTGILLRAHRNP